MKGFNKIFGAVIAGLALSSSNVVSSSSSYVSNVYSLPVSYVSSVIAKSNFSYTMTSTRNDTMAEYTFYYEILKMDHFELASTWKQSYSINYRLRTTLHTDVSYANGLFNWFTETGNTKLTKNIVNLKFSSLPSDIDILNKTTESGTSAYRLCYPKDNFSSVATKYKKGDSMAYYTAQETYYHDSKLASYGVTPLRSKYDTQSIVKLSMVESTGLFWQMDTFSYPNTLENGETVDAYGTLSFTTSQLPDRIEFSAISTAIIAEGSPYGDCNVTTNGTQTVYLS